MLNSVRQDIVTHDEEHVNQDWSRYRDLKRKSLEQGRPVVVVAVVVSDKTRPSRVATCT